VLPAHHHVPSGRTSLTSRRTWAAVQSSLHPRSRPRVSSESDRDSRVSSGWQHLFPCLLLTIEGECRSMGFLVVPPGLPCGLPDREDTTWCTATHLISRSARGVVPRVNVLPGSTDGCNRLTFGSLETAAK